MGHSYNCLLFHLVFSTKERRPWLDEIIRPRLHPYLAKALQDEGGTPLIVNSVADHVHILTGLHQDCAVAKVLRAVKANSSGWIHKTFPTLADFAWQAGYGAFTVSASQKDRVYQYIAKQEEHHRQQTFQEEFVALLKAHGIPYDERYIWN